MSRCSEFDPPAADLGGQRAPREHRPAGGAEHVGEYSGDLLEVRVEQARALHLDLGELRLERLVVAREGPQGLHVVGREPRGVVLAYAHRLGDEAGVVRRSFLTLPRPLNLRTARTCSGSMTATAYPLDVRNAYSAIQQCPVASTPTRTSAGDAAITFGSPPRIAQIPSSQFPPHGPHPSELRPSIVDDVVHLGDVHRVMTLRPPSDAGRDGPPAQITRIRNLLEEVPRWPLRGPLIQLIRGKARVGQDATLLHLVALGAPGPMTHRQILHCIKASGIRLSDATT